MQATSLAVEDSLEHTA